MRTKQKNPPPYPRFGAEAAPAVAPFRATLESEVDRLKNRLLLRYLSEFAEPEFNRVLRQAANEAAAIACTFAHPLLLLPSLLEEKARDARKRVARQNLIRSRSQGLLAEAAA